MQQILDLHIHSRYSRACSKDLTLANIDKTCRIKGVDIIATGDFTYPAWFESIKNELEEIKTSPHPSPCKGEGAKNSPPYQGGVRGGGLYKLKSASDNNIKFILSTEFALIYKQGDKCRRIHLVVHAPSIEAVDELNKYLDKHYNIRSDGRPILGMSAPDLMKLCLSIHPKFLIYPAHIWTPWFSVFGSKSGFDKMEECFGDYTKDVYAYETGLSSDPEMNWRLCALDKLTLLSNSDAHSLPNIGREANVFEMNEISYDEIYEIVKNKKIYKEHSLLAKEGDGLPANAMARQAGVRSKNNTPHPSPLLGKERENGIKYTIEFYPEEGMYHFDGHRDCGISMTPDETKKNKGLCPKCKKPLIIGVLNRVEELADRPNGYQPKESYDYKKLVELDKIIAEALNIKSRNSKAVKAEYDNLIKKCGKELDILINKPIDEIKKATLPIIAEGIKRVREGKLIINPGFDGQYGKIKIFEDNEKTKNQKSLF